MSHEHNHSKSEGNIKVAFFLNLAFTIIEIFGGIYTNSVAIMSDAIHDLGDSISLGLAWYFQNLSKKGHDENYSYGYKRFSLLGAIINSLILFGGSIIIIREAILNPQVADAEGMIYFALLGIAVNGAAAYKLMKGETMNERVVYLHLLEDVLGWVAVMIGAIIMYFYDLPIIDPILSIGIAGYILFNVVKNIKKSMSILLQGVPEDVKVPEIEKFLNNHELIKGYHDLHIWSMDGSYNILTIHIELNENIEPFTNPKNIIKKGLIDLGIEHPTIEIHEHDDEDIDLH